jgi:LuxR family maltose regulon positive regulatory protein
MHRPAGFDNTLVRMKLRPPASPRHEIARTRVVAALDAAVSTHPVVVVHARAGAGKTTAVAQWVRERAPSAHWCSIDVDDDATRLWRHALAIDALSRPVGPALEALEHGDLATFGESLLGALQALRRPVTLVLDNVDTLTDPVAIESLPVVLARMPPTVRVVLLGRATDLAIADDPHTRDHVAVVDDDVLRLDSDEAAQLLAVLGIELDAEHISALVDRTEGWIAGVRLAGLARRDRGSGEPTPVDPDIDEVFDYLRDEVLHGAPPHLRAFMIQTSVVEIVTPDLCDILTEQSDSVRILREIRRRNLFVEEVEGGGQAYRYHPLMRALLESELERTSSARHRQLHVAAAEWYERAQENDTAMTHWLRAGRTDRAWKRFGESMIDQFTRERNTTIERWARLLPHHTRALDARQAIGLALAQISLGSVDAARLWMHRVEADLAANGNDVDPVVGARLAFVQYLLEFAVGDLVGAARLGTRAHQLLDEAAPGDWERLRAPLGRARLLVLLGQPDRGRQVATSFGHWLDASAAWLDYDRVTVPGALAEAALAEGRTAEAAAFAEESLAMGAEHPQLEQHFMVEALHVLGTIAGMRGDLGRARGHLARAISLADRQSFVHLRVLPRIALARVAHADGDARATARQLLREARALTPASARTLRQQVRDAQAETEHDDDLAPRRGAETLTFREREVWRYLATGMSMREIAGVLFISRNTLKSHVRNIYQKLEVSNRMEAVERQRSEPPDIASGTTLSTPS